MVDIYFDLVSLLGSDKVTCNVLDRLCYSRDVTPLCYKWINLYSMPPYLCDFVVQPQTVDDIKKVFEVARKYKTSINTYGGGSGVVGGVIPLKKGITVDMSRLDRVIELDEKSLTVKVEAGIIAQVLEDYLNRKGYTLRHFPQSLRSASIGGLIATKSTGQFSSKYGGIENYVVGLEVVLPDCRVLRIFDRPRSSTGPDINNFFIGSEGIYGIITKAILKIYKIPDHIRFQCYVYKDIYSALEAIRIIMQSGLRPPVVRLYNEKESELKFKNIGFGCRGCLLILSFEGVEELVSVEGRIADKICLRSGGEYIGGELGEAWYKNRFDTRHILEKLEEFGGMSDAIEISASWSKIGHIYSQIEQYFRERDITLASHFSHAYVNGISSYNIFYTNEKDEQKAIETFYKIWYDIMAISLSNGGTISHHHGIGMVKSKMLRDELNGGYFLIESIKKEIDPEGILNPGKLLYLENESRG